MGDTKRVARRASSSRGEKPPSGPMRRVVAAGAGVGAARSMAAAMGVSGGQVARRVVRRLDGVECGEVQAFGLFGGFLGDEGEAVRVEAGGVGAVRGDGVEVGGAEFGGLADEEVGWIAFEGGEEEGEGGGGGLGAEEAGGGEDGVVAGDGGEADEPFAVAGVEGGELGAGGEAEDVGEVVGLAGGGGEGDGFGEVRGG